jgi:5-formyltetrahydrofolate cyclo-ligase
MYAKQQLRNAVLFQRSLLVPAQKQLWDASLVDQLKALVLQQDIKVVHTFIPMKNEVGILPFIDWLLKEGVYVVCPKSLPKRALENRVLKSLEYLERGIYGTQHPASPQIYRGSYDLIIVPGLAFDKQNNRMGYGAGYYDTFLAKHPEAKKVGVCYPFQLVDEVPTAPHDLQLNEILTA